MTIDITVADYTANADGTIDERFPAGDKPLDVRAFPGAEGLAALTRGAAGHTSQSVAFVDNLNDSGVGSLRAAIEGAGNEGVFVIFRTSGNINLTTVLESTSSNITLAFQTSPSGVAVVGAPLRITDGADWIIRHGRFRCGSHQTLPDNDKESLSIFRGSQIMVAKISDQKIYNGP